MDAATQARVTALTAKGWYVLQSADDPTEFKGKKFIVEGVKKNEIVGKYGFIGKLDDVLAEAEYLEAIAENSSCGGWRKWLVEPGEVYKRVEGQWVQSR